VLVQTAQGEGGRIFKHPNTLVDRFNVVEQRVFRVPQGSFPPPGIQEVGHRVLSDGSEESLLVLWPGASFRIHRTGGLEGAAPQLEIGWDGTWSREAMSAARTSRGGHRHWGMYLAKQGLLGRGGMCPLFLTIPLAGRTERRCC
jgi:hypothetical protein